MVLTNSLGPRALSAAAAPGAVVGWVTLRKAEPVCTALLTAHRSAALTAVVCG